MVEEGTNPPPGGPTGRPRVVKKVVKKTVTRPAAPSSSTNVPDAPERARAPKAPQAPAAVPPRSPRTTVDVGAKASAATGRVASLGSGVTSAARRAGGAARHRAGDLYSAIRDLRVPRLAPLPASAVAGLLGGLFVAFGGWLCLLFFSAIRGNSAGGALWGGLALLVVLALAFEGSSRLLQAFGTDHARPAAGLALMIVAMVVMLVFIEPIDGPWAWLILPGLSAVTLPLVQRGLAVALAADEE